MRTMKLGTSDLQVPVIAVGCMRITRLTRQDAERFVKTSLELGANFYDHADIYGAGRSEEIFADAVGMSATVRDQLILQSKCGIVLGKRYDFSKEHILSSVDGSLKRLKTDYLDVLLLHRPDALMEPEEIAEAFDVLTAQGKVRHFGVSNFNPMQIMLLRKFVRQPILCNQLQFAVRHAGMVSAGIHVNTTEQEATDRDGSILDYCRVHDITIQPWSPFQDGTGKGVFLDNPYFPVLNAKTNEIAARYGVSNTTIAMAWLLRHPANMQPVTGTMNVDRLAECAQAVDLRLTRAEWYEIYLAAGYTLP